jgi:hypothetical protein
MVDEAVRTGIVHGDLSRNDVVHAHWKFIPSLMRDTDIYSVLMQYMETNPELMECTSNLL